MNMRGPDSASEQGCRQKGGILEWASAQVYEEGDCWAAVTRFTEAGHIIRSLEELIRGFWEQDMAEDGRSKGRS